MGGEFFTGGAGYLDGGRDRLARGAHHEACTEHLGPIWWTLAGAMALAALGCGVLAARRAYTVPEALARLDEVARLHNRLTAALAGVGEWPERRADVGDAVRWNWARLGVPLLIGGLLLAAAALIEVPRYVGSSRPNEEPLAWTQLESWAQTLEQAKEVDPPALEKLKEQVNGLREQPEKDWYSQSSLEAGDALRQQTEQSLHELEANLAKSADLVEQAQNAGQMSASNLQSLSDSLHDLGQSLASGNMPANKELTGKLGSFDPSSLKSLNQQQLQSLQQRLANGSKICNSCTSPSVQPGNGTGTGDGHRSGNENKNGGNGNDKTGQGASGHPGGGGTAPMGLDADSENLHAKRLEGASNDDLNRARCPAPGTGGNQRANPMQKTPLPPARRQAAPSLSPAGAGWR